MSIFGKYDNLLSGLGLSEKSQKELLEYLPLGICLIDKEYHIGFVNSVFLFMSALENSEEAIGRDIREIELFGDIDWNQLNVDFSEGKSCEKEGQHLFAETGREIYFKYKIAPREEGLIIFIEDLTDIKRTQADVRGYISKLQLEQSRLSASIDSLPVGFIILDYKNNILIKNRSVDRILDLKDLEGNVFLKGDVSYINDKLKEGFDLDSKCSECMQTRKPIESGDVILSSKTLNIFIGPIIPEASDVIGVAVMIEDITEVRVLERAKEEFFSIASHELRTPLTSIRGNSSMILEYFKDEIKNPEVKEMVTDIYDASIRLIGLVNDFLNVSRLEQKRIEFKIENFDIGELCKKDISQIENLAKEKGLALLYEFEPDPLPSVFADKNRTEEVLLNLIGNAIKFTEKGSITVRVSKESDSLLRIKIVDTGRGIASEQQNLLFRKFQQAGESLYTRDTTKGTGLGLYISKLIVEGMGGAIGLESSEANVGSVFYFTLPIAISKM